MFGCFHVSFGLCVKFAETVLRLVLVVGVIAKAVGAQWSVQSIVPVVKFLLTGPVFVWLCDFSLGRMQLLRMVILVVSVITSTIFLYVSLALLKSLLQLIGLVMFTTTCAISFDISWMYALVFIKVVIINIITAITVSGNMGTLVTVWLVSQISNCSVMSHPKSGILLSGMAFLLLLVFPTCSSLYSWQIFSVMGDLFHISAVYLCCVSMIVFDFNLVLS